MIRIENLTKTFSSAGEEVKALRGVTLTVGKGEIYGVIGLSGAGKSTLVRCINLLEKPDDGRVLVGGRDLGALSLKELRLARRKIAMIFQHFDLLQQKTCLENVLFPLTLAGERGRPARDKALKLLELVGLPDKAGAYPAQLSGGQQQRVAIARALATDPEILLCDEATSALDPDTTHAILTLIRDLRDRLGLTVVIITHQMSVVREICDKVAILDHGAVTEEGEVAAVLADPRSRAARRLVYHGLEDDATPDAPGQKKIRLLFNGAGATTTPLIAGLARDKGVLSNILSASTYTAAGEVFGTMLLGVPEGDLETALSYFAEAPGVTAEEV
ncbi:MAG: ATP-binding cassette domain-containing protein [Clostridia bacterium]|nr:ATP-binding cassette domain-containing protein [Clostridia bacterium]